MILQPGIYLLTQRPTWLLDTNIPCLLEVTKVEQSRITYNYAYLPDKGEFSRYIGSFLEGRPIPASTLMKELL